ncbi:thiamine diphosphokinase [Eubacterium sp.]
MGTQIKKCTIISGAPDNDIDFLKENIDAQSFIICADSGYKNCLKAGLAPNLIIGDFDSSKKPDIDCEIISLKAEKAFTDTFHCVMEAVERGYNEIRIFCAIGSRLDHTYSNILSLDYCQKHGVKCSIQNRKNKLSLINGKGIVNKDYDNFSLFAYLSECKGVRIKGAYYTAGFYDKETLDIKPSDQFAQSNFVSEDYAEISLDEGTLLLIESND